MSRNYGFNLVDLRNVVIHALIVFVSLVVAGALGLINVDAFGSYGPLVATAIAAAVTAVKRWAQDNSQT